MSSRGKRCNWEDNRSGRNFRSRGRGSRKPYGRGQFSNRSVENKRNYYTDVNNQRNFSIHENINREFIQSSVSHHNDTQEDLSQYCPGNAQVLDTNVQSGPYTGWKLYITDEEFKVDLPTVVRLKVIEQYYIRLKINSNQEQIEEKGSFVLNFKDLTSDDDILKVWPDIKKDIQDTPEKCISCFGLAMHQVISRALCEETRTRLQQCGEEVMDASFTNIKLPKINAQLLGYSPQLPMKNLKSNCYGKFVSMKGTVIRVSNVKPLCTKLAFVCGKCGKEFVYSQPYGKYSQPVKCSSKGCRSQIFNPLRGSPKTETVDWQSIKLQEITDDQKEVGRMPRTIECELMYDLVDTCVPGDVVAVSGIVQVTNSDDSHSKSSKDKCTFVLYILANSISNCRGTDETTIEGKVATPVGLDLTMKDLYAVQAIQAEEQLFKLLIASLCPSIYGHEMVKAGLILGLFGGSQKFVNSCNRIPIRGDPHILVVGDPGLGKSQMLQACANVAPRGVYVCGNTTTTSGLTVTLSRESGSGDYALEAGALVLADQGCCCIDEFDKMSNQHHALLEAMEQQTISIAKAGIVCSLPARTSILAAANPVGGHYNKAKTVSENLKMGSALLSRFDLVFILLDKPDQEMDSKLSEHVMALHARQGKKPNINANLLNVMHTQSTPKTLTDHDREKPLSERLKYSQNEECDPIPSQLLRKYIAYARKYVQAKISPEAAEVLQKFYLELRKRLQTSDTTPITTRQLESLIRLTEARARLELRELCTKDDASDVVEIMKHSMIDVWSDNFGLLDITRSQHGSGMTGRSQAKKFVAVLTRLAEQTNNSLFSTQQMRQIAKDANINILDFENFLISLNTQGFLIKKARGIYKLLAVDY